MSEMAKKARAAMKEKAQGRAAPTKGSVDASGWTEPTMNTTAKVGMRPISRRQFKKGGKVEGEKGVQHAGKAPRKGKYYGGEMATPDFTSEDAKRMAADEKMRAMIKADAEANAPIPRPRRDRIMDRLPTDRPFAPEKRGGRTGRASGGKSDNKHPYFGDVDQYKGKKWDESKEKWVPKKKSDFEPSSATRGSFEGENLGQGYKAGGRSGRASGGKALTANSLINRDVKEANEERGYPHVGGYKKGGMANGGYKKGGRSGKKDGGPMDYLSPAAMAMKDPKMLSPLAMAMGIGKKKGGKVHEDEAMDKKLIKAEMSKAHPKDCTCKSCGGSAGYKSGGTADPAGTRPTGGRMARKSGGRTKGKTNIVIHIDTGAKQPGPGAMPTTMGLPGPLPRPPMPVAPPPMAGGAGMPPMGAPPAPMGGAMPPGLGVPPPAMGPLARKSGGRAGHGVYRSYKDMDAGAGGGLGRLEKTEIEKRKN